MVVERKPMVIKISCDFILSTIYGIPWDLMIIDSNHYFVLNVYSEEAK